MMTWKNKILDCTRRLFNEEKPADIALTLEVKNERVFGKTIAEILALLHRQCMVLSILHKETSTMRHATNETLVAEGDQILMMVRSQDSEAIQALIGRKL